MAKQPPSRDDEKFIQRFRPGMAGDRTVRTLLQQGFSLAIFCKHCPRTLRWTPPELLEKFGDRLDMRLSDLAERLTCKGEGGCGSTEVAVGPEFYDEPWIWPPPDKD